MAERLQEKRQGMNKERQPGLMIVAAIALLSPLVSLYMISGKFAPKPAPPAPPTPPGYREVWSPHNQFAAIVVYPDSAGGPNALGTVSILSNDRDPQRRSSWRVAEFTSSGLANRPGDTKIGRIDWKGTGNVIISYTGAAPHTLMTSFRAVSIGDATVSSSADRSTSISNRRHGIQFGRPVNIHFQPSP